MKFQPSMLTDAPLVPVIYARLLIDTASREGANPRQLTHQLPWDTRVLQDPAAYISIRNFFALVDRCLEHCPASILGARYGAALDLSAHGLQAFSLLSPDSPGTMVRRLVQVLSARLPLMSVNLSRQGRSVILQLGDVWPMGQYRAFITDAYLGSICQIASSMTRNFMVHIPARERTLRSDYEKVLGCRVMLGQSAARIIVSSQPTINELCGDYPSQDRGSTIEHDRLVMMIQQQVVENPGRECTLERVAERLGTTPRTLSRHMKDAGESFTGLRNRARKKFAMQYLADDSLSIAEIAERLGYADQASFTKAFVLWTGEAPGRLRRRGAVNNPWGGTPEPQRLRA